MSGVETMKTMTMRQRMLALVQGREHDRVPFAQYTGTAGTNEEIWDVVGRENMGVLQWIFFKQTRTPNCSFVTEETTVNGYNGLRTSLVTPKGRLEEIKLFDPVLMSPAIVSHFVKEREDYEVLMAYFEDTVAIKDYASMIDVLRVLGEDGLPHTFIMRTPYQQLWVEWVGIQDLAIHMATFPDLMEEVFVLMRQVQRIEFEVLSQAVQDLPIPYLAFADNITAPMIGEANFRKYCLPAYNELADMLDDTGLDIPVYVHMDGDLKPLWSAISDSRVRGLDSLSPPPDNDTSVANALALWPEMRVCANFPSSVHLKSAEEIYQATMALLEEGGHSGRLQIQISENVPPGIWYKSIPQIVQAIRDFGPIVSLWTTEKRESCNE